MPLRTSTTGIRKSVQNSSIDDQDNSQSFGVEKQNVGESRISIYDMETQNFSCSSYNETNIDIHDAESQKICILNSIKNLTKSVQEQNVDMGKQSKIGAPEEVTDIHDIETQHDIDFHDIETAKKINIHNFKTQDNSIGDSEKLEKTGIEEEKNSTMEGRSNVNNTIIQEKKDNDSTSHCNITKDKNKSEKLSDVENDLQKRVEVVETSEDDASDFDMSRNLLSPQDLEEFEDDNLSDEIKSRSPTSIKASCVNDDSGVNSKSIDNENIYEAATQVNKIDKNDFRASLVDDSDDTDNEVVFQRYSRNDSQESKKSSKNQVSDSDDSITDEEGHFTEIAAKVKKAIETSLEIRHNRSKEMKNGNSSRDSEDLFNMLTQPSNLKNEDLSSKCNKKLKDNENENEVDSDSPTQVIDKKSTNMEISKEIGIEEIDDMASTQILPMNKSSFRETSSIISTRNNKDSSEEDITEMEYNRPTQIINTEEKALDTSNNNRLASSNSSVLITIEEYNTENIDYEMACTQPIGDIEKQTSVSSSVTDKNENKSKSTTMNFDDSVERKLKVMFKNTIEEHIENQPQISIQALENILELSQKDESPNVNSNSTASRKATKSKKGRKSETAIVKTSPSSASHKKSCNSPLSLRQHNTANLESVRNIINEESEKETEDLLISNSVPTDLSTPKSTIKNPSTPKSVCKYPSTSKSPKDPSTPKSLRQKHFKESKIANTVKNDNDKLKNCEENVGDQKLGTSNGEQLQQISKILISEDEDILAGLPEVRISGTLSNPPSPTLSEYRININKNRTKQISIKIAPKKRGISRKSSRRTLDHRIIENATHIINEPNSMATSESSSNSFVNNLNADKISVCENDEKKVSDKSKGSMKKTKNLYSSKRSDSLPKSKSINSQEKTKQSLSIPSNRRTRKSVKENTDFLSVFQVEKEVLVEKVVAAEPAIKNVVRKSRFRKRSLSMTDVDNSSPKKRKDINGDVSVKDSNKKIINGRQSENILDFIVRKNLSNNGKMSEEANLNKEAIVKVERISLSTPTGSISNTSTESEIENDNRNRNRQNRYKNVVNSQIASSTLTKEIKKTTQNVEMRRNTSRRITKKNKSSADDISSEVGEESQEVEMIMNGALKEQNTNSNTETKKNARNTRMRSTRKRGNTNVYIDTDNTETSSVSSVLSEPDNAYLEVPISRNKRAKVTKNSLIVTNTTVNEYIKETRGGNKRSTRSTRGQQSIMDSSVESIANQINLNNDTKNTLSVINTMVNKSTKETKKNDKQSTSSSRSQQSVIDSIEENTKNNRTELGISKTNSLRDKRQTHATGKVKNNKQWKKDFIEETSSSETNTSNEITSILSTPNRTRRSMSSSFAMQSPLRIKHKILFTGISSNDYNKLLTKLGIYSIFLRENYS